MEAETGGVGLGVGVRPSTWRACLRPYLVNALVALPLLVAFCTVVYLLKDHLKALLFWVETQNQWLMFALFLVAFAVVSFPVAIGYLVLIIASGYLLGVVRGLPTVLIGANLGVAVAHYSLRFLSRRLPLDTRPKNETARAMLRVIAGPHAFRIVLCARLTPIPFGLQNAIFAVSHVRGASYHLASALGLFPAQLVNIYLGSTLRSMHDVLQESHLAGYVVFACQITIGITLMVWIVQRARRELTLALLEAEMANEGGGGGGTLSSSSSSTSLIS